MRRSDYEGQQLIFAVAQQSFEAGQNCFSTLRPLATLDGKHVDLQDFGNRGLAWWMVRGLEFQTAAPGRLIVATVEDAKEADSSDPDKDAYQVAFQSVKFAGPKAIVEVLTLSASWSDPVAIISKATAETDHQPAPLVLVRMRGALYGPFKSEAKALPGQVGRYEVGFSKQLPDRPIYRLPAGSLATHEFTAQVSLGSSAPNRTSNIATCRYELAQWGAFESACNGAEVLELVTDDEIVRRAARLVLTKARANELVVALREVQAAHGEAGPDDDHKRLIAIIGRQTVQEAALEELTVALVNSSVLKPRLEEAIARATEMAVQSRAFTVRAQAEADLSAVRTELETAQLELGKVQAEAAAAKRRAHEQLAAELSTGRAEVQAELKASEAELTAKLDALRREQRTIEGSMASAIERLKTERQRALADFLVMQPFLEALGQLQPRPNPAQPESETESSSRSWRMSPIVLPPSVAREGPGREPVDEEAFFQRLLDHVDACGFRYERRDLVAFHVATKVADLSILGGVSGTGKSSLPRLYTQALMGDETPDADRFLAIDVSPAWSSPSDLLGFVNVLDHSFSPSASGIFTRLAEAALEYAAKGAGSGIHLVCLDEMNLAQVEHYFSSFIQALSRDPVDRCVAVFDPNALSADDPMRSWGLMPLRENIKFVGTVNFDETTRRISQRVLDRADLIQLKPRHLFDLEAQAKTSAAAPVGPCVKLSDMKGWVHYRPLPEAAASLFEAAQAPLTALGCPLTPRRQSAIARYLASAERLCTQAEALDLQIAQRVIPQISGIFRPGARQALEALDSAITAHAPGSEVSRAMIANLMEAESFGGEQGWDETEL